jgi:hypothetical protein
METKVCSQCLIEKKISEFYKNKETKTGYRAACKVCQNKKIKEYKLKFPETVKEFEKKYFQKNKEKILKRRQEWRKNNPEKYKKQVKDYWEKVKDVQTQKKKIWIANNREKYNSYWTNRKKKDPEFALKTNMRSRICDYLKKTNITKRNKTFDIVGCTPQELKEHLEKQFVSGMTWDNRSEWHIDHIIPLSSTKNEEELMKLFHYTNLQPLWAEDNLKKSNKIEKDINN